MHVPIYRRLLSVVFLLLLGTMSVIAHPNERGDGADIGFDNELPKAGKQSNITLFFLNLTAGYPIPLEISHERIMHVFIVGEDLDTFLHTHPEDYPDGTTESYMGNYRIYTTFPKAGRYLLVVDYTSESRTQIEMFNVSVEGNQSLMFTDTDYERTKQRGPYAITLQYPDEIYAGVPVIFTQRIAKDGMPVTDLQRYLGSELHVFVIDRNLLDAGHTHAYIPGHTIHTGTMPQRYSGPTVPIQYSFSAPGTYAFFTQFRHNDEVITTKFLINVTAAPPQQLSVHQKILTWWRSLTGNIFS